MDGYRASQLIRASEAVKRSDPMAIVAITAGSVTKANDATAYQEAGMNELIHKPFSNAKLMTIFNKCIEYWIVKTRSKREKEGRREGEGGGKMVFEEAKVRVGDGFFFFFFFF
jgi:hypothetical protein